MSNKPRMCGNYAKLREALEIAIDNPCAAETDDPLECCVHNCTYQEYPHGVAGEDCPWKKIRAALAAPPRNCDRFGGDYKMLNMAWFDWTGSPSGQNPDGTVKLTFAEWLLAPATEKEGGGR